MPKKVDENVDRKPVKKPKYKKGRFPYTVLNIETKVLYVRKSITVNETVIDPKTGLEKLIKQKQIWRVCEPQTAERALELFRQIESDLYFSESGDSRPLENFGEICDEFIAHELVPATYEKGKKVAGRRSLVSPRFILKVLKDYFGNRKISSISFGDLEKFKVHRLKTPVVTKKTSRPRAIRTVNYELSFLRQVFNFAYRRRWLARSPFSDGREIIDVSSENRRHVSWTREEEAKALALCVLRRAQLKPVIICITDAGFRWGELAAAKWKDVNFAESCIDVTSYKNKKKVIRRVYITERIKAALREWKIIQKGRTKTDNSLVIGYKSVKNAWREVRTEIGRPDLHLHDLRHVFATRLYYEAKADLGLVSAALGHSSIRTTEIYVNAQTTDVRDAVKKLDQLNQIKSEKKSEN